MVISMNEKRLFGQNTIKIKYRFLDDSESLTFTAKGCSMVDAVNKLMNEVNWRPFMIECYDED